MKVFCSYAFTGEDKAVLGKRLSILRDFFEQQGIAYYMNIFAPHYEKLVGQNAAAGDYVRAAIEAMKSCDTVLVLQASERRSEGVLIEIGAALAAGKKIVLAQHESSVGQTYLPTVANTTFVWRDDSELLQQVREYFGGTIKD